MELLISYVVAYSGPKGASSDKVSTNMEYMQRAAECSNCKAMLVRTSINHVEQSLFCYVDNFSADQEIIRLLLAMTSFSTRNLLHGISSLAILTI
jgi:hypothetical protein